MYYVDIAMFATLAFIAARILKLLWESKDGYLRVIMILFFISELQIDVGWLGVLFSGTLRDITLTNLFILYLSKLVIKLIFFFYLKYFNFKS